MAYVYDLGTGQRLYVENRDTQTILTLASGGSGQQQSQSNACTTGAWQTPPVLFRSSGGLVLRVEAAQGQFFFQIQSSGMNVLQQAPALAGADVLSGQQVAAESVPGMQPMKPMEPMQPMKPMEPMQMGDMQMQMKPMQMRMGNMQMQMDSGKGDQPRPQRRFCPQCGDAVKPEDRFCAACGHRLKAADE